MKPLRSAPEFVKAKVASVGLREAMLYDGASFVFYGMAGANRIFRLIGRSIPRTIPLVEDDGERFAVIDGRRLCYRLDDPQLRLPQ